MAEELIISTSEDRADVYAGLLPQIKALVDGEPDVTANLANICSALKYGVGFFWVGFYAVKDGELVLGPFQGPVACTRIQKGKGVCGTAWEKAGTIIVPDVDQFPGHIACSSASRSEIVVPVLQNGEVVMILDVDSDQLNDFNTTDQHYLEQVAELVSNFLS